MILGCANIQVVLVPSMFSSFYRHENISLRSITKYDCPNVTSQEMTWSSKNEADGQEVRLSVPTDQKDLDLPARSLPYGRYRFTFTVRLRDTTQVLLSTVAFLILQIIPSKIQVNLLSSPLSTISHGYLQELVLDPGQHSVDPEQSSFPTEVFTFSFVFSNRFHSLFLLL